ncbi:MAG: RNA-binding protein [Alphaproteobacteria bacterium]|nr:RNA-binding protein [Alphaproteobacteria bacterium]MBV9062351.1 RNA-binding protein [Alphaproteobacteria bacterium]
MLMTEAPDREDRTMRTRRCIVTREVQPECHLVRFVVGPEDEIVPDLAAKLPGRGIWVSADRGILERAVTKNLFARAAKTNVRVAAALPSNVEALLVKRLQDHLGLARRSGVLVLGFDNVLRALESRRKPLALVEASDGADDGRRKVLAAARAQNCEPQIIDLLTAEELSMALGREHVIHAALFPGPLADRLVLDAERLEGFRPRHGNRTGPSPVPDERSV